MAKDKSISGTSILTIFFVLFFILPLLVYPVLRDMGLTIPSNEKVNKEITNKYFDELSKINIGYIKSGSGSVFHGGSVSAYKKYSLMPSRPDGSWDYLAPAYTPHAHIIVLNNQIEVKFSPESGNSFDKEIKRISDVIEFFLAKHKEKEYVEYTWQ